MNLTEVMEQAKSAREAGFSSAADVLEAKVTLAKKLAIAYEHHRFVSDEQVVKFNRELRSKSERPATSSDRTALFAAGNREWQYATKVCDQLTFVGMETYKGLPPADVLEAVKIAKGRACFDSFEVAEINPIATQIKHPDPIVFGRIVGCSDRFFVAEWGTDVKIGDLLQSHEG